MDAVDVWQTHERSALTFGLEKIRLEEALPDWSFWSERLFELGAAGETCTPIQHLKMATEIGQCLYRLLLGETALPFRGSKSSIPLKIRLHLSGELHRLPWELLCLPQSSEASTVWLACDANYRLSRVVPREQRQNVSSNTYLKGQILGGQLSKALDETLQQVRTADTSVFFGHGCIRDGRQMYVLSADEAVYPEQLLSRYTAEKDGRVPRQLLVLSCHSAFHAVVSDRGYRDLYPAFIQLAALGIPSVISTSGQYPLQNGPDFVRAFFSSSQLSHIGDRVQACRARVQTEELKQMKTTRARGWAPSWFQITHTEGVNIEQRSEYQ